MDRQPPGDSYDLIVIVDTGSWSQLEESAAWLKPQRERIIVLDHHAHGEENLASTRWVDRSAASATMIVAELLDEMHCPLSGGAGGVAEAIFAGLATDTGWFRHSNADARAFALASRLIAAGVDPSRLLQMIEQSHRPARLSLMARALASVEYGAGGAAAVMTITPADFKASGGSLEDLTGLVNEPLMVASVRVSALVSQSEPGTCKISLRSKPAADGSGAPGPTAVDVNAICRRWGGGGHVHAAGARVSGDLAPTRRAVIEALEETVGPRLQ
jgi:phosphoesterase RecJ-like protein